MFTNRPPYYNGDTDMYSLIWKPALPVAALSLASLSAAAAPLGSDGFSMLTAAVVTQAEPDGGETFNMNFEGGTVADYTAALKRAVKANIVLIEPAGDVPLPPMNLSQVSFYTAMSLLDDFTQQMGQDRIELHLAKADDDIGLPVYTVRARLSSGLMQLPMASAVISVAGILQSEAFSPEDCMGAIDMALEVMGGDREPAQIRFHPATGLLIARGAPEQINAIHEVVGQLWESAESVLKERNMMPPEEREELRQELEQVSQRVEEFKRGFAMQKEETDLIRRKMEEGRHDYEQVIKEREAKIFELQQRIHELEARQPD